MTTPDPIAEAAPRAQTDQTAFPHSRPPIDFDALAAGSAGPVMSDQEVLFDLAPPASECPTQAPTAEQAKRRRKRELSDEYVGLGGRLDVWQRCPQCASQFFAEHRCHMADRRGDAE